MRFHIEHGYLLPSHERCMSLQAAMHNDSRVFLAVGPRTRRLTFADLCDLVRHIESQLWRHGHGIDKLGGMRAVEQDRCTREKYRTVLVHPVCGIREENSLPALGTGERRSGAHPLCPDLQPVCVRRVKQFSWFASLLPCEAFTRKGFARGEMQHLR